MPSHNSEYWAFKIGRNVERDRQIVDNLTSKGWTVLRFWEHADLENAADEIMAVLDRLRAPDPSFTDSHQLNH
jgi:DNA mismatch endonuclease, patch repair protein